MNRSIADPITTSMEAQEFRQALQGCGLWDDAIPGDPNLSKERREDLRRWIGDLKHELLGQYDRAGRPDAGPVDLVWKNSRWQIASLYAQLTAVCSEHHELLHGAAQQLEQHRGEETSERRMRLEEQITSLEQRLDQLERDWRELNVLRPRIEEILRLLHG